MKKILQDKRIVGALVGCSVVLTGWPAIRARLSVQARSVPATAPVEQLSENPDPAAGASTDKTSPQVTPELRDWMALHPLGSSARDPFRRLQPHVAVVASAMVAAGLPTLQATSSQGGASLAVLDRRIVSVGSRLGEFVVEAILSGEVLLRQDGNPTVHRLKVHAPAQPHKPGQFSAETVTAPVPPTEPSPLKLFREKP